MKKRGLIAVIILLLSISIANAVDYPTHSTLYTNEIKPVSDPPLGSGITASTTVTINAAGQITRFNYGGAIMDVGGILAIKSDGKVGIGTNAPGASLHVAAENNNNDGTIKLGARAWLQHRDSGETTTSLINDYNSNLAVMDFRMKGAAAANAVMTILGSGRVGIGTASPAGTLEVASGEVRFPASAGLKTHFNYPDGKNYIRGTTYLDSGDPVYVAGNLGIGTNAPSAKLDVAGSVKFSNVADRTVDSNYVCLDNGNVVKSLTPCKAQAGIADTRCDVSGACSQVCIGTDCRPGWPASAAESDPQVATLSSGKWCRSDGTAVQCDQSAPINSKWTDATGGIYYTAKVGIGDMGIPQQQLDIGGQGIHITGNANGLNEYNGLNFIYNTASLSGIISARSSTTTSSNPAGVSELRFRLSEPQNTADPHKDVMTLKGTGRVGIGTTNPVEKLEVSGGNIKVSGTIKSNGGKGVAHVSTGSYTGNGQNIWSSIATLSGTVKSVKIWETTSGGAGWIGHSNDVMGGKFYLYTGASGWAGLSAQGWRQNGLAFEVILTANGDGFPNRLNTLYYYDIITED